MSNLVPILGVNRHRLLIDGEGVTTLVAFHGCPLHCKYCLNLSLYPMILISRFIPANNCMRG